MPEYQQIEGFADYRVGDDGTVWTKRKSKKLRRDGSQWHELIGGKDALR